MLYNNPIKIFPEIEDTMENLAVLKLDATAIQALPSSLCRLVALEELSLHYCERLETIPSSIGDLSKLCKLGLSLFTFMDKGKNHIDRSS